MSLHPERAPSRRLLYVISPDAPLPPGGAEEVGNKAWNLMRMAAAGLPVPSGLVLPTSWCRAQHAPQTTEAAQGSALSEGIAQLEATTRLGFGSPRKPLLVSVRSGAAISMPGMMETVLDIGVNDDTIGGLMRLTGNLASPGTATAD
jgi:pyruvate, orthophosphate dikinase